MKPKRSLSVVGLCLFCKELVDDRSVFRVAVQCGVDPSVVKRHYGRKVLGRRSNPVQQRI